MYQNILAPIDGSLLSAGAVGQVLELARSLGAKVTFFHAKQNYLASGAAALDRVMDPVGFNDKVAGDARAIIAKAEAAAVGAGVEFHSVIRVAERPFEAILQVAEEQHCDLIFMASHGQRGFMGLSLGSQTQRVLNHARVPVLVSPIEGHGRLPEMDRALAVYRDEHRSIAAVVHGLGQQMQQLSNPDSLPNLSLLRAMIHYLETFPEQQHHPREEECLFRKLRGRDEGLDALIDKLEAQHLSEAELLRAIGSALERCDGGGPTALAELAGLIDDYAQLIWTHMTLEDKVIVGHARDMFTEQDWREVGQSFADNDAPSLGGRTGEDLFKLLVKIMNRVAVD